MHTHQGIADVNGTRLYYELTGPGDPLVLIHGNTLDTRMWDDQLEPLARRYQVIRYDMRGYGKSALPHASKVVMQGVGHMSKTWRTQSASTTSCWVF